MKSKESLTTPNVARPSGLLLIFIFGLVIYTALSLLSMFIQTDKLYAKFIEKGLVIQNLEEIFSTVEGYSILLVALSWVEVVLFMIATCFLFARNIWFYSLMKYLLFYIISLSLISIFFYEAVFFSANRKMNISVFWKFSPKIAITALIWSYVLRSKKLKVYLSKGKEDNYENTTD